MPRLAKHQPLTSKKLIEYAAPGYLWDSRLPGFGVLLRENSKHVWIFNYRNADGVQRRVTIGRTAVVTPDRAFRAAADLAAEAAAGGDPVEARRIRRRRAAERETLADFFARYLRDYARTHKAPRSVAEDVKLYEGHMQPALGRVPVNELGREHAVKLHQAMRDTPVSANRALSLFSKLMSLAELWGARPDNTNPCRHVERYREEKRHRFLDNAQLAALGRTLAEDEAAGRESANVCDAIRLLLFTGCRKSEVLTLEWAHVDLSRGVLDLPTSKTGRKTVVLNAEAVQVLERLKSRRKTGESYVLPGRSGGRPLAGLPHAWIRIRQRAGLGNARVHDLRHTFGSAGAQLGASFPAIGALLGHTTPQTTLRYAGFGDSPLRAAAERIGGALAAAMGEKKDTDGGLGIATSRPKGGRR